MHSHEAGGVTTFLGTVFELLCAGEHGYCTERMPVEQQATVSGECSLQQHDVPIYTVLFSHCSCN